MNNSSLPNKPAKDRRGLVELALLFLRLGSTAFGGPAAHIAMMEDEVVRRRGWLSREERPVIQFSVFSFFPFFSIDLITPLFS